MLPVLFIQGAPGEIGARRAHGSTSHRATGGQMVQESSSISPGLLSRKCTGWNTHQIGFLQLYWAIGGPMGSPNFTINFESRN
jgi:hypothetical protein